MKMIKDYKVKEIPIHKIVIAFTTKPDYEMDRCLLVEDYPEYSDYLILNGGHCSCYDFDEVTWDGYYFAKLEHKTSKEMKEEISKLMHSWTNEHWGAEEVFAKLVIDYLSLPEVVDE